MLRYTDFIRQYLHIPYHAPVTCPTEYVIHCAGMCTWFILNQLRVLFSQTLYYTLSYQRHLQIPVYAGLEHFCYQSRIPHVHLHMHQTPNQHAHLNLQQWFTNSPEKSNRDFYDGSFHNEFTVRTSHCVVQYEAILQQSHTRVFVPTMTF